MKSIDQEKWNSLKRELTRLFFIGVGVFLFILFFQPFPLVALDYNNRLLYVTGFGLISFLIGFKVLILFRFIFPKWFHLNESELMHPFILSVLLIFSVTAYIFYIRFVGNTVLTLYILFKILLVCLLPIIILGILYKNKSLELIISVLQKQNKDFSKRIKDFEKNGSDEKIEILSENKFENFKVCYKDIIAIKSADNYIKVYIIRNNAVEMKIIRNTLKNIESQLIKRREFIRCHRTSIVNVEYISKLVKNYGGYSLKINELEDNIPVSRQYLIIIKEALSEL